MIQNLNELTKKTNSFTYCVNKGAEILEKYDYDFSNNYVRDWIEYTQIMCEQIEVMPPTFIENKSDYIRWVAIGYNILMCNANKIDNSKIKENVRQITHKQS